MGKPPYRTTSSSIDPWEFIRRPRTGGQIPHDFKAARIWLRDYLDRQYGVGGIPPKGERVRLAGVVVRKYFTVYFPNPAPKTGKPRLPDVKNVGSPWSSRSSPSAKINDFHPVTRRRRPDAVPVYLLFVKLPRGGCDRSGHNRFGSRRAAARRHQGDG